jgi:hypothetical protein
MHKNTAEGGLVTIDENVDHTLWPCIPHPQDMSCQQAQAMYRNPREMRVLRPLPTTIHARNPPPAS